MRLGPGRVGSDAKLDLAGVGLLAVAIGWTYVSAHAAGGDAGPVAGLMLATGVTLAASRLLARRARWLAPAAVAVAVGGVAVTAAGTLSRAPLEGPLGYANAAAALFLQAAIASLMVAACVRSSAVRAAGIAAAIVFAAIPFVRGSLATAAIVATVPVAVLVARAVLGARWAIVACAALVVLAVGSTAVLGATFRPTRAGAARELRGPRALLTEPGGLGSPGGVRGTTGSPGAPREASGIARRPGAGLARYGSGGFIERLLSERRLILWREALELLRDHPVFGVGPGRFPQTSPTAQHDRDARWAHDEFLQQGAEQGLPGLLLLLALFLWGFARLGVVSRPDLVVLLGAASLSALGLNSSVDYVLHFPAVPLAAAALVGAAQRSRPTSKIASVEDHELELAGA